eukprot:TRINITY_DN5268_c0_g1_i1.p1 TRINITY_DN5268_c0_g1~~TRINITY_DN5268_c0_g1_i1.p1  ORF type:complete len:220 (+),score=53.52 TRINITY_DN5268_c0_g1_i1:60-719(+)
MALSTSVAESKTQSVTVDLSGIAPPVPIKKTLMVVNQFMVNTTNFLNKFAKVCEMKLEKVDQDLARLEVVLSLLETKLNSIPWLEAAAGPQIATPSAAAAPGPAVAAGPPVPGPPLGQGPPVPGPPLASGPAPPPGAMGDEKAAPGAPADPAAPPADAILLKDDPRYKKYFVMLRVGVHPQQIKSKIQQDGLDPSVMDRDPNSISDYKPDPNADDSDQD